MAEFKVDSLLLETSTSSHHFSDIAQNDSSCSPNVMKSQDNQGDLSVTCQLKHVG
jgi:hypothetical protein